MITHPFPPVFDKNSKILLLGSFPSPKSRETNFYFGHPQNRFWKILSTLFGMEIKDDNLSKKQFLLTNNIALWDVVESCEVTGASDSSITNVKINNFDKIFNKAKIVAVFTIGKTATKLYQKYTNKESIYLPSTSPANCAKSFNQMIDAYKIILKYLYP